MRHTVPLIAILAFSGVTLDAQIIRPRPLFTGPLSFHGRLFGSAPLSGVPFKVDTLVVSQSTCPMPVVRTDSAKEDPMPVARGTGVPEPMPVVRSGCSNPLDRRR